MGKIKKILCFKRFESNTDRNQILADKLCECKNLGFGKVKE
jgi:hypothetical protein